MNNIVKLSIVTTLYKSQEFINEFYQRMVAEAGKCNRSFEIIFVDDGSPDGSKEMVKTLIEQDSRLMLVELSRNFGHHYALVAGLGQARGELVFLIDSDLEEQPEWLGLFWESMQSSNADVVFGVQTWRTGSFFKKYSGELFYKIFNLVSDTKIPKNLCTVRLMSRDYVQALLSLPDKSLFLAGNCAWAGFQQQPQMVQKKQIRRHSTYNITKMMGLVLNAITSFTSYPLNLVFFIGLTISTFSGIFGSIMIIEKLIYPERILLGYSSMMVSIWFLGGLIILFVGIIGLYLSKMFLELKGRPQYIIRKVYQHKSASGN
jgi:putative glycosyltransferase